MKAVIEIDDKHYLMEPSKAAEVIDMVMNHSKELWHRDYVKDPNNNYVHINKVIPIDVAGDSKVRMVLVSDEAYALAKMRGIAEEGK